MALNGIKVLELSGLAPAPFCGMILNDFGASVIRVDKIGSNMANMDCLSNGKKSLSLDIKNPIGANIFRSLCKNSDVLIEPYRRGVMEKLNLGPDILLKDNPRLIYARLTGYGQSGSLKNRAGHDINYVAYSGLLSLFGRESENPSPPINLIADFGGGGLMCAFGIVMALLERNSSGLGQVIDSSMVNGAAYLGSWLYRSQNLPVWGKPKGNNWLDTGAHFYEVYKTKDGKYMSVGALEPQFYQQLIDGLGLTQEDAEQFGNFKKLKQLFTEIFMQKTQKEWCQIFDDTDACVAPVLSMNEAPQHPHNIERQNFTKTNEGYVPNPAPKLSRTPGTTKAVHKGPERGEHTKEILQSLNFSLKDIEKFESDGVVETFKISKL